MKRVYALFLLVLLCAPALSHAQYAAADTETFERAKVISVDKETIEDVPGTDTSGMVQDITVEVLSGALKGQHITFHNDFTQLKKGDAFFLRHIHSIEDAKEYYTVADPYRLPVLWALLILFVLLTVLVGGKQGTRALVSLVGARDSCGVFTACCSNWSRFDHHNCWFVSHARF